MSVLILLAASGVTHFAVYAIQYAVAGKLLTGDIASLAASILIAPLVVIVLLWPFRRKNWFVIVAFSLLALAVVGYVVFIAVGLASGEPGPLIWAFETSLLFVAPTMVVFVALALAFLVASFLVRAVRARTLSGSWGVPDK